jgi:hypothetical protein
VITIRGLIEKQKTGRITVSLKYVLFLCIFLFALLQTFKGEGVVLNPTAIQS